MGTEAMTQQADAIAVQAGGLEFKAPAPTPTSLADLHTPVKNKG